MESPLNYLTENRILRVVKKQIQPTIKKHMQNTLLTYWQQEAILDT